MIPSASVLKRENLQPILKPYWISYVCWSIFSMVTKFPTTKRWRRWRLSSNFMLPTVMSWSPDISLIDIANRKLSQISPLAVSILKFSYYGNIYVLKYWTPGIWNHLIRDQVSFAKISIKKWITFSRSFSPSSRQGFKIFTRSKEKTFTINDKLEPVAKKLTMGQVQVQVLEIQPSRGFSSTP